MDARAYPSGFTASEFDSGSSACRVISRCADRKGGALSEGITSRCERRLCWRQNLFANDEYRRLGMAEDRVVIRPDDLRELAGIGAADHSKWHQVIVVLHEMRQAVACGHGVDAHIGVPASP